MIAKSGVYVLRVEEREESENYSLINHIYKKIQGSHEYFEFDFARHEMGTSNSEIAERATVRVQFVKDMPNVLKFEVNLGSIVNNAAITVWFNDSSIANNETFYTDSNGL
jgi:hypothetical protein